MRKKAKALKIKRFFREWWKCGKKMCSSWSTLCIYEIIPCFTLISSPQVMNDTHKPFVLSIIVVTLDILNDAPTRHNSDCYFLSRHLGCRGSKILISFMRFNFPTLWKSWKWKQTMWLLVLFRWHTYTIKEVPLKEKNHSRTHIRMHSLSNILFIFFGY